MAASLSIGSMLVQSLASLLATGFGKGLAVGMLVLGGVRMWETFRKAAVPERDEFRAWYEKESRILGTFDERYKDRDWREAWAGVQQRRAERSRKRRQRDWE